MGWTVVCYTAVREDGLDSCMLYCGERGWAGELYVILR